MLEVRTNIMALFTQTLLVSARRSTTVIPKVHAENILFSKKRSTPTLERTCQTAHNHEQEFEKQSESPWGLALQPSHATMQTSSYRTWNDDINASFILL